jgi:hypothetical protein
MLAVVFRAREALNVAAVWNRRTSKSGYQRGSRQHCLAGLKGAMIWSLRVFALLLVWFIPAFARADNDQLVVVSMRQYLIQGESRIHLYLYAFDGTFKKALTDDKGFNDLNPIFSDDGKSIYFKREAADRGHAVGAGEFVLDVDKGSIRRYDLKHDFFSKGFCDRFESAFSPDSDGWLNLDSPSYQSPDGKFSITEKQLPPEKFGNETGHPHNYDVAATGKPSIPMAGLPGFIPADEVDGYESFFIGNGSPYITDGDMEVVFLRHHLNSTEGEQTWALDLTTMTGAKISNNGAEIYHPPSAPGVFVVSQARYLPLGNTGKTVNCSYLEWWDAHLKMLRYGPDLSVFYSAAIYGGTMYKKVVIPSGD